MPTNITPEIMPCPFCGSEKHMLLTPTCTKDSPYDPNDRAFPMIRCMGCYVDVPGKDWDHNGKTAREAWNRRAALAAVEPKPVSIHTALQTAYLRGAEWYRENDDFGHMLQKAAYDYADKETVYPAPTPAIPAGLDAAQEAANLQAVIDYMEQTNARKFDPSRIVTLVSLVKNRLERAAAPSATEASE